MIYISSRTDLDVKKIHEKKFCPGVSSLLKFTMCGLVSEFTISAF